MSVEYGRVRGAGRGCRVRLRLDSEHRSGVSLLAVAATQSDATQGGLLGQLTGVTSKLQNLAATTRIGFITLS